MKKLALLGILFFGINSYSQTYEKMTFPEFAGFVNSNKIICDASFHIGTAISRKQKNPFPAYYGGELTISNFAIGFGFKSIRGDEEILNQPVHVKSYYRKDGTYVHSYNRAKPGHKGETYCPRIDCGHDFYLGYWLPCQADISTNIYLGYFLGVLNDCGDKRVLYGTGFKILYEGFGISCKVTNSSFNLGITIGLCKNHLWW